MTFTGRRHHGSRCDGTVHRDRPRHDGGAPSLRLTSMMDVCFLLLIFFILTASFPASEGVLPHDMPGKVLGELVTPDIRSEQPIRIDLHSIGTSDVSIQLVGSGKAVGSVDELFRLIDAWRVTPDRPGAPFLATDPVIIRPDATVAWGQVVNVFNAAVRARYQNVNFAAAAR